VTLRGADLLLLAICRTSAGSRARFVNILCFLSPLSPILLSAFCRISAGSRARFVNILCFLSFLSLILLSAFAGHLHGAGQGLSIFSVSVSSVSDSASAFCRTSAGSRARLLKLSAFVSFASDSAFSHLQDLCREQGKACQYFLLSVSSVLDSAFSHLQDLCREQGKASQY
jgi:hypothetical protein